VAEKRHWADKPILRDLLWFLVLPYQAKQWLQNRSPLAWLWIARRLAKHVTTRRNDMGNLVGLPGVAEGRHQTLSDQSPMPAPSAIQSHLKGES
jgi:hypothetical protein